MTGARRLPPYGRELADARRRGLVPVCPFDWLMVAVGWPMARRLDPRHPRLVADMSVAPDDYDWRAVAGLDVLVVHDPADRAAAHAVGDAIWPYRPRTLSAAPVPCEGGDRWRHWHPPGDIPSDVPGADRRAAP